MDKKTETKSIFYGYTKIVVAILLLVMLDIAMIHNLDSINQDIGRHLKLGEIIWQTKSVPKINLFSFTAPDFPFINHHWLTEVVFYLLNNVGGLQLVMIFAYALAFLSFIVLAWAIARIYHEQLKKEFSFPFLRSPIFLTIAFLLPLSLPMFINFSSTRPQNFSFLFFSIFVAVLLLYKNNKASVAIWLLPLVLLLWVNTHIYFFLGPFLYAAFFLDRLLRLKTAPFRPGELRKLLIIGALLGAAMLANPNFLIGAIYPLQILRQYAIDVVENKPMFSVENGSNWIIFLLIKLSIPLLALSFFFTRKNRRKYFEMIVSAFLLWAAVKMMRNLPFWGLWFFIAASLNIIDIFVRDEIPPRKINPAPAKPTGAFFHVINILLLAVIISVPIFLTYFIASNQYYEKQGHFRTFGLSIPKGAQGGVDFIKSNNIHGPIFNDFDIGSYLIWKLYPTEKVFIDGRPEAYPEAFIKDIYFPMFTDNSKWNEYSQKYNINLIVLEVSTLGQETERFLTYREYDPLWRLVYLDNSVIIFLRDTPENKEIISRNLITSENALEREAIKESLNSQDAVALGNIGRVFFVSGLLKPARAFYEKALAIGSENGSYLLGLGLIYAQTNDRDLQRQAAVYISRAIDLGLDGPFHRLVLGKIYYLLGEKEKAQVEWQVLLDREPNNPDFPEIIDSYKKMGDELLRQQTAK